MSDTDLATVLNRMSTTRILCVGDVILDRFIEGSVHRLSPEAPIPVLNVQQERTSLGGAANVARNLSALGAQCALVGAIGIDAPALEIQGLVGEIPRLDPHLVAASDRPTAVKTRFIAGQSQMLRADWETVGPYAENTAADIATSALGALGEADALILSDYGKGLLSDSLLSDLIQRAREKGIPVVVDPKGSDYSRYAGASWVTPNRAELNLASAVPASSDETVVAAARKVIKMSGVHGVLATRSEQGMTLVSDHAETAHLAARAREVFDVAGAGDTVVASFAAGLALGLSPSEAAALANQAAGVVVAKTGTAVAYPDEILSAAHEDAFAAAESKVMPLASARDQVDAWRRAGKLVGFTNGCFDLLHPGHISLIRQARAACDKLVLGLNSDSSVQRLKGPTRPVQSEAARAAVLAAIAHVDLVVVFGEDTPLALIHALRPDVLVKGADYTKQEIVGAAEVESWGGRVVRAELVDGHSTTRTIARMAEP